MTGQDNRKSHLKRALGTLKLADPDKSLLDAFRKLRGGGPRTSSSVGPRKPKAPKPGE